MNTFSSALIGSLLAGLATAVGALPIFFKKNYSKTFINFAMGVSAGIMLVPSFVSLLLPGIEQADLIYPSGKAFFVVLLGLFVGYFFIIGIHEILPHEHMVKANDGPDTKSISRVFLIVLAITIHNFPEGLSVGVGFGSTDSSNAIALALAIAAQNVPEGLIIAFGLVSEGAPRWKAFLISLASGLVEPVAAVLGFASTQIARASLPVAFGFAAGAMLFVVCQEIFPELFREGREKMATFGVILGIVSMVALDHFLG